MSYFVTLSQYDGTFNQKSGHSDLFFHCDMTLDLKINSVTVTFISQFLYYYVANFEEVDGAYWFRVVRPSVRLFETCMPYLMNHAC